MELQPYYGEQTLSATNIVVRVNADDRQRAEELVAWTTKIKEVTGPDTFTSIKHAAGRLKAMLNEIDDAKKAAKRPFGAVETAIGELAGEIAEPVQSEHTRLLGLLNGYVAKLERERAEEDRRARELFKQQQAAAQKKIDEALAAKRAAELKAQEAMDEAERLKAQQLVQAREQLYEQAQLAAELEAETIGIQEPRKGLVPGGRVDHPRTFHLTDVWQLFHAKRLDLLRYELNIRACQDEVARQLEKEPDREPRIPGVVISTQVSVSVRAQAGAQ